MMFSRHAVRRLTVSSRWVQSAVRSRSTLAASNSSHRWTTTPSLSSPPSSVLFHHSQRRMMSAFMDAYKSHVAERAQMAQGMGVAPAPLLAAQVSQLIEELQTNPSQELVQLLATRVPPGVDEAAYVKASYLSALALQKQECSVLSREYAIELLGTMQGGYNVATLVDLLKDKDDHHCNACCRTVETYVASV